MLYWIFYSTHVWMVEWNRHLPSNPYVLWVLFPLELYFLLILKPLDVHFVEKYQKCQILCYSGKTRLTLLDKWKFSWFIPSIIYKILPSNISSKWFNSDIQGWYSYRSKGNRNYLIRRKNNPFVAATQMRKHDSTKLILFVLKEDLVRFCIDSEKICSLLVRRKNMIILIESQAQYCRKEYFLRALTWYLHCIFFCLLLQRFYK